MVMRSRKQVRLVVEVMKDIPYRLQLFGKLWQAFPADGLSTLLEGDESIPMDEAIYIYGFYPVNAAS